MTARDWNRNRLDRRGGVRCDGVTRRDFLRLGSLTAFGFGLSDLLGWKASAAARPGADRASSCILIWLDGGPSHLDTFDPKPEAPSEIRGPFKAIATAVEGLRICEHLPRTAKVMREVALVRSLSHELGNHDTGTKYLLTGHRPGPALEYPSLGSVVARHHGFEAAMPPYVAVPNDGVGGGSGAGRSGYLPAAYAAFSAGGGDSGGGPDLALPEGVTWERTGRRREWLREMDAFSRRVEEGSAGELSARSAFYEQAYRLLASAAAKEAFDLGREPAAVRDRYGRSRVGSGCLLARRVIEAGARFVTVVDPGWDTHQQIARELPDSRFPGSGKLPALDRAYAALIGDLKERGLLETTLVVLMGEFGRTPKLNAQGGRDHWPRAGFVCLAGGGVRGGQVIGATDAFGELPVDRVVGPPDLAYSILHLLGVDPSRELRTSDGRPVRVMAEGTLIRELT